MAMTKTETVRELSERSGVDRKQVGTVLEELAKLSYEQARDGFTIPGLGKLVLVDRKARVGRNPATGEQIQIPAKRVLKFRIAKQAKDAVLAPKGARRKQRTPHSSGPITGPLPHEGAAQLAAIASRRRVASWAASPSS